MFHPKANNLILNQGAEGGTDYCGTKTSEIITRARPYHIWNTLGTHAPDLPAGRYGLKLSPGREIRPWAPGLLHDSLTLAFCFATRR